MKWNNVTADRHNIGKWFALVDCDFDEGKLLTCTIVDEDPDLAALQERIITKGIKNCIIKQAKKEKKNGIY